MEPVRSNLHHIGDLGCLLQVLAMGHGMNRKRFTAYVVFKGAEHRRFWRIFTRRGWRHVFVVIPVYFPEPGLAAIQYCQIINPTMEDLRADVVYKPADQVCADLLDDGATCVIRFPVDQKFTGRYIPRGLLTCVSLVKALISVDAWWILTPEQLANYLLRNGGSLMEREQ